ncbi:hypothetical protein [Cellulosilyticum ruminicola]|uniref:hypothetical protein n=1 Tax=Cellulosilyticum ruminicola TaxID=425254 RepID=UPI0006CF4AB9|nr:hypothetical protein [Cellulosilyticum ruminicola]
MKKRNCKVFAFVLSALLCMPISLVFANRNIMIKEYNMTKAESNNISFDLQVTNNGISRFVDGAEGRHIEIGFTKAAGDLAVGQNILVNMRV